MNTKVVALGDCHFSARNDNQDIVAYQQRFFQEVLFPYMAEHKINRIIQFGDMFDRRKYMNFLTLHLVKLFFFDYCRDNNIQLDIIIGNHDSYFKNTLEVNSPELLLAEYDNVTVHRECSSINCYGCEILMIPWICDNNREFIMDRIEQSKAQVAIGHLELSGFQMYRGQPNHDGLDHKIFDKFEIVMSGHFHHASNIDNIHYIGAPYEMVWSDANDPRGFSVFDCSTRQLEYIENPLTLFHKIKYDDSDKKLEQYQKADFSIYKGSFIKIVVIEKTQPLIFDYLIDQLEGAGVLDIQVVEDHLYKDVEDQQTIVNEGDDTLTILNKHIDDVTDSTTATLLKDLFAEMYATTSKAGE